MRNSIIGLSLLISTLFGCRQAETEINYLNPAEKNIPDIIDGVKYGFGNWETESGREPYNSPGNHRAVVKVESWGQAVRVHIQWRRNDKNPQNKEVIIIDAITNKPVHNKHIREINNIYGDIIFQPVEGSDTYYFYYFPFQSTGGYYPVVTYFEPKNTAEKIWYNKYSALSPSAYENLPQAKLISLQSTDKFNSFFPMEVIATRQETDSFMKAHPADYHIFPEYRNYPARMKHELPWHWINRGRRNGIRDYVQRGEYYSFQLCLFAKQADLSDIQLTYSDLKGPGKSIIGKENFQCINIDGVDLRGKPFEKVINVKKGDIQALWLGFMVPADARAGVYKGKVIVKPAGHNEDTIYLSFDVLNTTIADHGDNQPENMTRLRWLNSTAGIDKDYIIAPYLPLSVEDNHIKILGRELILDKNGLPAQILSYFSEEMTGLNSSPEKILQQAIGFEVNVSGKKQGWNSPAFRIKQDSKGRASWETINQSKDFSLVVNASIEYDGMLNYNLQLISKNDIKVDDIKLNIPMMPEAAGYILGLGQKGSVRPENINWKWDVKKNQEGVWLGNVNKGLQYVLRDLNYERPLNTNFYHSKPLNLPHSWYNQGKGGIRITSQSDLVLCENYTGPRSLSIGDTLNFNIRFLITPFKTIDWKKHFSTRFVHMYVPVDSVIKWGGTVINVHHANDINPYINYPFYHLKEQKDYIDKAHKYGIKVKLYNTIREITYKCYEIFPLRSLSYEILNDGDGGGHPWLQEHLADHYYKAWHAWRVNDAAILNKGTSRWTNYYIEGLSWLVKNQDIDGLYLDDIAFDRGTVKRMVNVMAKQKEGIIIDLHSANQFNDRDGFINSAFLYMEHFPYITRLWFGEYFEYDRDPDYWLTEVSGIPFGLTGEMLQDGGNPYRGMIYGMTTRMYGERDPRPLWKFFDQYDIASSKMLGYWLKNCPVKTNNEKIKASVYKKTGETIIAIASWEEKDTEIRLLIDWEALGIDPENAILSAPAIENFQASKEYDLMGLIHVHKKKGLLLILK